jgi:hypothetical protein
VRKKEVIVDTRFWCNNLFIFKLIKMNTRLYNKYNKMKTLNTVEMKIDGHINVCLSH